MKLRALSLLHLSLLACGAAEGELAPLEPERPNDTKFAEYRVPVEGHPELEPYAVYPVSRITYEREGDDFRFGYGFPRGLAGARQHIALLGAHAGDMMSFPIRVEISHEDELVKSTGSCARNGVRFECYENLSGIKVDRALATERLLEDGKTSQEIEKHLRVTELFSGDPIGIVTFELKDGVEF